MDITLYRKILGTLFKSDKVIYPSVEDRLKAFVLCQEPFLKVVILGQDPYHDGSATGLAFANSGKTISPSLRVIAEKVKEEYDKQDFDYTLESWAKQGVLLLNTALTVEKGIPGSHINLWKEFMIDFIERISEAKRDVIFLLWGKAAEAFSPHIKSSFKLIYPHPMYSIYTGKKWDCPHFRQANEILDATNKKQIQW